MKKSVLATLAMLVLAFALPFGSAFAVESPDVESPDVESPDVESPDVESPDVESPDVESPDVESPDVESPDVESPDVSAPGVTSTGAASPSVNVSNVAKNSIGDAMGNIGSKVSAEGILLSPKSGAPNLVLIAGGTVLLFVVAGGIGLVLYRKLR